MVVLLGGKDGWKYPGPALPVLARGWQGGKFCRMHRKTPARYTVTSTGGDVKRDRLQEALRKVVDREARTTQGSSFFYYFYFIYSSNSNKPGEFVGKESGAWRKRFVAQRFTQSDSALCGVDKALAAR